jgi:antitoxin ParD1/3/4
MENMVAMGNTSLNISLPEGLKAFVKERVQQAHYSTPSDYVRDLIRADQKRQAKEKLDQLLLEGLEAASEEVTPEYLEQLRHDIQALIAKKRTKSV